MRSVTSYFNPTLYRKNLTRFWPIWTAWTVLWAFLYPLMMLNEWRLRGGGEEQQLYRYFRDCLNMSGTISEVAVLFGAVYGVLVAMAVFSYLYSHRSAAALHALPLRRETHFVTNFLSGLTFLVLPNLAVFLPSILIVFVTLPGHLSAMVISTLWSGLWLKTGVEFFFYSFAVFCAQFTGNIFALPAFYGILNGLVAGMYSLIRELGDQILYGGWPFGTEPTLVKLCTPGYMLTEACDWKYVSWSQIWNTTLERPEISKELNLTFENPAMVGGYVLAGLVLAGLALLVYRRRNIETAGDVVSVKIVRPIFRAGVAACAGLSGGIVTAAFFGEMDRPAFITACVAFWAAVGHIVAEMLLQKSFRVWKKTWKSGAATVLTMVLVMTGIYLDVLGMETWIPDTDKVDEMCLTINSTYPYDAGSHMVIVPGDEAGKERIVNIHESIIRDYEEHGRNFFADEHMSINLTYTMKNGATYSKRYYDVMLLRSEVNQPGSTTALIHDLVTDREIVEEAYGWDQALNSRITHTRLENVIHPSGRYDTVDGKGGAQEIWEAVKADFAAGNLGKRYIFDDDVRRENTYFTDLQLCFWTPERAMPEDQYYYDIYDGKMVVSEQTTVGGEIIYNWTVTITLTPQAKQTLAALEKYYDLGEVYNIAEHEVG